MKSSSRSLSQQPNSFMPSTPLLCSKYIVIILYWDWKSDSLLFCPFLNLSFNLLLEFQNANRSRISPYCPFVGIFGNKQNSKLLKRWYGSHSTFMHIHKSLNLILQLHSSHKMKNRFYSFSSLIHLFTGKSVFHIFIT